MRQPPVREGSPPAPHPRSALWKAWAVHLLTASGAVFAFLALIAVVESRFRLAFVYLFVATVIDAVDGLLARRAGVKVWLPWFDGAKLDDIVDYLTFVFVPVFLIHRAGLLPPAVGLALEMAVLLASAYGFNRADAKSADHFFTGFPSYWNIVAFYLYLGGLPAGANAAIVAALCVLVFVPIGYIYPTRTTAFRRLTLTLGVLWGGLLLILLLDERSPARWMVWLSLVFPIYYTAVSLFLHLRRNRVGPFASSK